MLKKRFKNILWEYDLSILNEKSEIVWERVFSLADKDLSDYWIKKIGKKEAKKIFIKVMSKLDKKSLNFWWLVFWVDTKTKLDSNKSMYEMLNIPIFSRNFR